MPDRATVTHPGRCPARRNRPRHYPTPEIEALVNLLRQADRAGDAIRVRQLKKQLEDCKLMVFWWADGVVEVI